MIADWVYSFPSCRLLLRPRGIPHMIPERRDQRERRGKREGRPPSFDTAIYTRRNVVERYVNRFKQWRGVDALREAGSELPGSGGDCRAAESLAGLVS